MVAATKPQTVGFEWLAVEDDMIYRLFILGELVAGQPQILDAHCQRIGMPDSRTLGLEVAARHREAIHMEILARCSEGESCRAK